MASVDISSLATQDDRIRARRKRAEDKLRAEKDEAEGKKGKKDEVPEEVSVGAQQVGTSHAILERIRTETWEGLTDIRVRFDDQENKRRIAEENNRLDRYEALQIEAVTSGRKNAAIEMRWAHLLTLEIPQQLNDQLQFQKTACRQIIESKERRIADFQDELKTKDEEYIKMLKTQSSDISELIEKMRDQYDTLRRHYEQQLDVIETSFEKERGDLISTNKSEMDNLFEKRAHMEETEFLENRQKRERGFQQKIEELRMNNADVYNNCKISLEKGIQELEQHLEKMIATYTLNKEKLDYNLTVLQERNKEHQQIQSSYKSRLARLRGSLSKHMSRYTNLDQKYKDENDALTDEYRRLTKQFKDLQEKFHHFEKADEQKYWEVRSMHEQEVRALGAKVLDADRLLHEQQFGHEWSMPREEQLRDELDTVSESGTTTGRSATQNTEGAGEHAAGAYSGSIYSASKVKKVLDLVKEETFFLLDHKVLKQMENLPPEQRDVVQIEAILRYIGVDNEDDVDLLVTMFYPAQDRDDEALFVDADEVLEKLRDFIEERDKQRSAVVTPDKKKNQRTATMGSESEADRKARRKREEKKLWKSMAHVIPDTNYQAWQALDLFLRRYYELLQRRSKAIDSAVAMQKQNEELKQLLDQYLGSKVNEELQVPPTHVIRVVSGQDGG